MLKSKKCHYISGTRKEVLPRSPKSFELSIFSLVDIPSKSSHICYKKKSPRGGVSSRIWGRDYELINDGTGGEGGSSAMGDYSGELGSPALGRYKSLPGAHLSPTLQSLLFLSPFTSQKEMKGSGKTSEQKSFSFTKI